MSRFLLFVLVLISVFLVRPSFAQDARTQQAMRALTTRLRTAETERTALQAEKLQSDQEKKALTEKLDAMAKQAKADSEALAAMKTHVTEIEGENGQMKDSLQKLEASQGQAVGLLKKTEAERAKLSGQVIELQRKVADRETKNLALFKLANEILARYERFGLGDALAAKEPFTGLARVKLENYVQDYQDKIADQHVKH